MGRFRDVVAASLAAAGIARKQAAPRKSPGKKEVRDRDRRAAPAWNIGAHPVEFLEARLHLLCDPAGRSEREQVRAIDAGKRRARMAREYRDLKEEGQVTPLRGIDYTNESRGSGFGPSLVGDHVIDCIKIVNEIEGAMPLVTRGIMESVLVYGRVTPDDKDFETVLEMLRFGLDIMAVVRVEMRVDEFRARWPGTRVF